MYNYIKLVSHKFEKKLLKPLPINMFFEVLTSGGGGCAPACGQRGLRVWDGLGLSRFSTMVKCRASDLKP